MTYEEQETRAIVIKMQAEGKGIPAHEVYSDRAGAMVGNAHFRAVIFNEMGEDGITTVFIDRDKALDVSGPVPLEAVLEGEFDIYESDCSADRVAAHVSGSDTWLVYGIWDVLIFRPAGE